MKPMDQAIVRRYLVHVEERVRSFGRLRSVYHDLHERVPHVDLYIIEATSCSSHARTTRSPSTRRAHR
jgi:hypothetical protein